MTVSDNSTPNISIGNLIYGVLEAIELYQSLGIKVLINATYEQWQKLEEKKLPENELQSKIAKQLLQGISYIQPVTENTLSAETTIRKIIGTFIPFQQILNTSQQTTQFSKDQEKDETVLFTSFSNNDHLLLKSFPWEMIPFPPSTLLEYSKVLNRLLSIRKPQLAKEIYTISEVAKELSKLSELEEETCQKIQASALLLSIGKLGLDAYGHHSNMDPEETPSSFRDYTYKILKYVEHYKEVIFWTLAIQEASPEKLRELGLEIEILHLASEYITLRNQPKETHPFTPIEDVIHKLEEKTKIDINPNLFQLLKRNLGKIDKLYPQKF